jgi:hypothetical protein
VDALPTSGPTVSLLKALDFVVPGQWQNIVGFENTIKVVTGETDQNMIQKIGERAIYLFNDKSQGYQRALWLYQTINSAGGAIGTASLISKIGESVSFLSFLNKITPKADKAQTIDLSLKLVTELLGFCNINGIPGDSIGDFVRALADYSGESLMRMAALVCVDGLLPLGPDFVRKVESMLSNMQPSELKNHAVFGKIASVIPGGDLGGQLGFINQAFGSVQGWMSDFVSSRGLTQQSILGSLQRFVDISESKLDYVAAFLDMTTNYYEHTGIQTLARRLIERAVAEI